MLACQVAVDALRVLAATTEAGEQAKEQVTLARVVRDRARGRTRSSHQQLLLLLAQIHARVSTRSSIGPVDPDTPKLLPSVHLMWSPLMGALTVRGALCVVAQGHAGTPWGHLGGR